MYGCSSSGSGFSFNDYDYDNSNSNVSSHLCKIFYTADPATWQKITKKNKKGVGTYGEDDFLLSKGKK